jgi:hypothetical protein
MNKTNLEKELELHRLLLRLLLTHIPDNVMSIPSFDITRSKLKEQLTRIANGESIVELIKKEEIKIGTGFFKGAQND